MIEEKVACASKRLVHVKNRQGKCVCKKVRKNIRKTTFFSLEREQDELHRRRASVLFLLGDKLLHPVGLGPLSRDQSLPSN